MNDRRTIKDTREFFRELSVLLEDDGEYEHYAKGDIIMKDEKLYRYERYWDDDAGQILVTSLEDGGQIVLDVDPLDCPVQSRVSDLLFKYSQRKAEEGIYYFPLLHTVVDSESLESYDLSTTFKHPNRNLEGILVHDIIHPCFYLYRMEPYLDVATRNRFGKRPIESSHCWIPYRVQGTDIVCQPYFKDQLPLQGYLEQLLKHMLPGFQHTWRYIKSLTPPNSDDDFEFKYHPEPDLCLDLSDIKVAESVSDVLPNDLQFYIKVVDIEMEPESQYSGVWHLEGMPQEHIVATGIYYLDSPLMPTLAFKREFHEAEHNYVFSAIGQSTSRTFHDTMATYMPLGSLDIHTRGFLFFPNTHVHKVQPMRNNTGNTIHRRFVVFFMVDPELTLPDTTTVDIDKVISSRDNISVLEQNMTDRMIYKHNLNPRDINFCEH